MLTLGRKVGEKIIIGDNVSVIVRSINRHQVKIGIIAPQEVLVLREELKDRIDSSVTNESIQNKKSNNFEWKDFSKEKPSDHTSMNYDCIVRFKFINDYGDEKHFIDMDWYDSESYQDENGNYCGAWEKHNGQVTHWCFAHELPQPTNNK